MNRHSPIHRVLSVSLILLGIIILAGGCGSSSGRDHSFHNQPILNTYQLDDGRILFSFSDPSLKINRIEVAGDFSWKNRPAGPFLLHDEDQDGVYKASVRLDPGQYMYRFILNGKYLLDPISVQESSISGYAGSVQVYPARTPRLLAVIPPNHSILSNTSNIRFKLVGDLDTIEPKSLRVVINQKPLVPSFDASSGTGSFTIPTGSTGRITIAFRAMNGEGIEVLNDTAYFYKFDSPPLPAPIPPAATAYRILVPFFGPEAKNGNGTLQDLIDRLDYLNDGKKDGKSLGITHLFLHALYPAADPYRQAPQSYSGFGRGGSRELLTRLLSECGKRGIKVIMHFNAGYTSNRHPWFQDAFGNLSSKRMRWYQFLDSRHTRYSGFMGQLSLPLLRVAENDQAQAFFLNTVWDWIRAGLDGLFFEFADLQENSFWKNKLAPSVFKFRQSYIMARDGRLPDGNIRNLLRGCANIIQAPHFPERLLQVAMGGNIRKFDAIFSVYAMASSSEAYLKPTSLPGMIRPGSMIRRNSYREALLGTALTGAGIPVINYGDELGASSPAYPKQLNPPQMPWNLLASLRQKPAGLFNLARTLIRLRKESPLFRHDRIKGRSIVFFDNEKDEPHAISVRWSEGDSFYAVIFNPTGVNTTISREIKIRGLPDGKYAGREILTPGEKGVDAEAEEGTLSISSCPTQGRGFLVYRFTRIRKR